jgi:hypothetical protein
LKEKCWKAHNAQATQREHEIKAMAWENPMVSSGFIFCHQSFANGK